MTDENACTYPPVNPGGNKRVLVIDDMHVMLDLVEIMLQMEGYEVVKKIAQAPRDSGDRPKKEVKIRVLKIERS